MTAIRLERVCKSYSVYRGGFDRLREVLTGKLRHRLVHAVQDISLVIPEGQVVGIVGRNGAGKSTLLKLVAGTLSPSSGIVQTRGRVGAILELGSGFHPDMTGRENADLSIAIQGMGRAEADRLYPEIVEFSGLEGFMDQPVKTYSSGMRMRLAFAVATSMDPDVLIVDEALSVGDGAFARKSFDRIMGFRRAGKTILFCSHSMYQVEALCSRVIWLEQGGLRSQGEPEHVVREYQAFLDGLGARAPASVPRAPVAGVPSPPVGPADSDRAPARLERIAVRADGLEGRELDVVSGQTEVEVSVSFRSNPALRAPSVALTLMTPEGRVVSSAGSKNDGIVLAMDASGHGTARVRFPRFPLLKGIYFVHVYLMCEEGVHIYESALSVAELRVSQIGLERGLVKLPRAWRAAPGPGEGYWDALSPARTVSAR